MSLHTYSDCDSILPQRRTIAHVNAKLEGSARLGAAPADHGSQGVRCPPFTSLQGRAVAEGSFSITARARLQDPWNMPAARRFDPGGCAPYRLTTLSHDTCFSQALKSDAALHLMTTLPSSC